MNLKNKWTILLIIIITIPLLTIIYSQNQLNPQIIDKNETIIDSEEIIDPILSGHSDDDAYFISGELTKVLFYSEGINIRLTITGEITFNDTLPYDLQMYVYSIQGRRGTPTSDTGPANIYDCANYTSYSINQDILELNDIAITSYKIANTYSFSLDIQTNAYINIDQYITLNCSLNGEQTLINTTDDVYYNFNPTFIGFDEEDYKIFVTDQSHISSWDASWYRLTENNFLNSSGGSFKIYTLDDILLYETKVPQFYPIINITLNPMYIENRYVEAINVDYLTNGLYYSDADLYNFTTGGSFAKSSYNDRPNVWTDTGVDSPSDPPQFDFPETNTLSFTISGTTYICLIGTLDDLGGFIGVPSLYFGYDGAVFDIGYIELQGGTPVTVEKNIITNSAEFQEIIISINSTFLNFTVDDQSIYFSRENDDFPEETMISNMAFLTSYYPSAISDLSIGNDSNHISSLTLNTSVGAYNLRKNDTQTIRLLPGEKKIIGIGENGAWVNVTSLDGITYDSGHYVNNYVFGGENVNITYLVQLSQMTIFSDLLDWESALNNADYINNATSPLLAKNMFEDVSVILYLKYDGNEVGIPILPNTDINKLIPIGSVEYRVYNVDTEEYETEWISVPDSGLIQIGYRDYAEDILDIETDSMYDLAIISSATIGSIVYGLMNSRVKKIQELECPRQYRY